MMKAVVFKGPYNVAVEDRPIPKIQDPTDIIVKVTYTAVCGRSVLNPSPSTAFHVSLVVNCSNQWFGGPLQRASCISGERKSSQGQNALYEDIYF